MIATLVDCFTSLALSTHKNIQGQRCVSTDIRVSYMKSAKLGDEILINASTINKIQLYVTVNPYSQSKVSYINGPGNTEYTVTVYSIYNNIFRVMGGHCAMVFAN